MSHIAAVNCEIKNLDSLDEALAQFDASLKRNKTSFKAYAGTNTKCNHVIEVNGSAGYSIGLRQKAQADEEYELACDFYDGSLERTFGKGLVNLRNEYLAAEVTRNIPRGYRLQREETQAGRLHLRAIG